MRGGNHILTPRPHTRADELSVRQSTGEPTLDDSLLLKYDGRAPRYTSYPTAPHFDDSVDAPQYARWLEELPDEAPISLYVHVPFCHSLCWFCGCQTSVVNRYEPVAGYLRSLRREIDLVCDRIGGRRAVSHVHFGGGSPTMIDDADFRALVDHLRRRFDFADDAEIAVEIDPRSFDPDRAAVLAGTGVNRASIGIQDFAPRVQEAINRIQPLDVTARTLESLRTHGVDRVSFDLLYGLPYQTPASMEETVETAAELGPDRVSLFGYAHVPWMKRHQRLIDEDALPGVAERLALYRTASTLLTKIGYVEIGIDHFALPTDPLAVAAAKGALGRNFQGYTDDSAATLIGFGASALGTLPQGYVQNASAVPDYRRAVRKGELATARGIAIGDDDRLRREIIARLMCDLAVDVPHVAARFGADPTCLQESLNALAPIEADGLIRVEDGRITISPDARPLVRTVCAAFDAYATAKKARHSLAI